MRKILAIAWVPLIIYTLSASGFNVADNTFANDLRMAEYSFNDFIEQFTPGDNTLFAVTRFNPAFDLKYKTKVNLSNVFETNFILTVVEDENSNLVENGEDIVITKSNFDEFRSSFTYKRSLKFDTDFYLKFYKVFTQKNKERISYCKDPANCDDTIVNTSDSRMIYDCYGLYENSAGDIYVLLGRKNRWMQHGNLDNVFVGWTKIQESGEKKSAVLWNTNIGLRPDKVAPGKLSPYVFSKDSPQDARNYANGLSYDSENLIVGSEEIDYYDKKYKENKGRVLRWLPMYDSFDVNSDKILEIGVVDTLAHISTELKNAQCINEIQIAFVLDGTASMTYVWQSLPKMIERTLERITESGALINSCNEPVDPRIKIYHYKGCPDIISQLYSGWIRNSNDLNKMKMMLTNYTTESSCLTEVPIYETHLKIIEEIGDKATYMLFLGDAGSIQYKDKELVKVPMIKEKIEGNQYYASAIRVNSGYYQSNHIAYTNFQKNFKNALIDDLKDVPFSQQIDAKQAKNYGDRIADKIIANVNEALKIMTNPYDEKIKNSELRRNPNLNVYTKAYIKKMQKEIKRLQKAGLDGTYFQDSWVVAKDAKGNPLLATDVLIAEEKVEDLAGWIDEFIDESDQETALLLIKNFVAIFMEEDISTITSNYLESLYLEDLWLKIVGDEKVGKFLMPEAFEKNYTFAELVRSMDDQKNIEQLRYNSTEILEDLMSNYIKEKHNEFLDIDDSDPNNIDVKRLYWVHSSDLKLFKEINVD